MPNWNQSQKTRLAKEAETVAQTGSGPKFVLAKVWLDCKLIGEPVWKFPLEQEIRQLIDAMIEEKMDGLLRIEVADYFYFSGTTDQLARTELTADFMRMHKKPSAAYQVFLQGKTDFS